VNRARKKGVKQPAPPALANGGAGFYPAGRFSIGLLELKRNLDIGRLKIGLQDEILPHSDDPNAKTSDFGQCRRRARFGRAFVLRSADQESRPKSRLAARTGGGTSRYNKDNAPIWPRSAAVEKFFQLSVLGLVASGFLAGSGYRDTPIQGSPTAWSRS